MWQSRLLGASSVAMKSFSWPPSHTGSLSCCAPSPPQSLQTSWREELLRRRIYMCTKKTSVYGLFLSIFLLVISFFSTHGVWLWNIFNTFSFLTKALKAVLSWILMLWWYIIISFHIWLVFLYALEKTLYWFVILWIYFD